MRQDTKDAIVWTAWTAWKLFVFTLVILLIILVLSACSPRDTNYCLPISQDGQNISVPTVCQTFDTVEPQ